MASDLKYTVYDNLPDVFNLADFLLSGITQSQMHKAAYYYQDQQVSYAELLTKVKSVAALLQAWGVEKETRVVLLLPDCLGFVYAFLAVLWLGGVVVIVNQANSAADIDYIVDDCQAKKIISYAKWQDRLHLPKLQNNDWWLLDPESLDFPSSEKQIEKATLVAKEATAFWVYTSGSTGRPKGVLHSHYNPAVAIENYGKNVISLTPDDIVYSSPSMSFSYGLGTSIYFPLYFKSAVVLSRTVQPFEHVRLINKYKVTVFFGIPHTYASIYAIREIAKLDTDSLRLCVSAGEKLSVSVWNKWKNAYLINICEGIGTTESTHIFISNLSNDTVPGSSGKIVPGYSARLVDEKGEVVADDTPGMLEISGEGFMQGYWNQLKATQANLRGQTMVTGDIYSRDKNANYFYIGRRDGMLKVKGMWVSPAEIERVLSLSPLVDEVAVLVAPGLIKDTVEITAHIKLDGLAVDNNKQDALRDQIMQIASQNLSKFKLPKKIVFVEAFPRTSTGKIHRKKLAELKNGRGYETSQDINSRCAADH